MDDGKRYTEYGLLGALAIGLVTGLLAGMAIYAAAYPTFQSSEWAAWVQAVGSVLAVIAAFMTVSAQSRIDRKNEAESRKAQLDGAVSIAKACTGTLAKQLRILRKSGSPTNHNATRLSMVIPLKQLVGTLDKIPFHEVPYAYASTELMNIKLAVQGLVVDMEKNDDAECIDPSVELDDAMIELTSKISKRVAKYAKTARAISDSYDGRTAPNTKEIRDEIEKEAKKDKKSTASQMSPDVRQATESSTPPPAPASPPAHQSRPESPSCSSCADTPSSDRP